MKKHDQLCLNRETSFFKQSIHTISTHFVTWRITEDTFPWSPTFAGQVSSQNGTKCHSSHFCFRYLLITQLIAVSISIRRYPGLHSYTAELFNSSVSDHLHHFSIRDIGWFSTIWDGPAFMHDISNFRYPAVGHISRGRLSCRFHSSTSSLDSHPNIDMKQCRWNLCQSQLPKLSLQQRGALPQFGITRHWI